MFRINVSKIKNGFRIRHKGTGTIKTATVEDRSSLARPFLENEELVYQVKRCCKGLIRDLLHAKVGNDWRSEEAKHIKQINKSIERAVKFAR